MQLQSGFTLVEAMMVLAIIGVLAALAYPDVAGHAIKARRTEAQAALLELMQQQERFFTEHNTYLAFSAGTSDPAGQRFKWYSGSSAGRSAHELSGQACPGQPLSHCIELKATPGTARVDASFRDHECGIITLDSEGSRAAGGAGAGCWP